jgi:hypothetical protein
VRGQLGEYFHRQRTRLVLLLETSGWPFLPHWSLASSVEMWSLSLLVTA